VERGVYKLTRFLIATAFAISTSDISALVLQEVRMKNFSGDLQTINELVIPSDARNLGSCLRCRCRRRQQTPRSLALLGM